MLPPKKRHLDQVRDRLRLKNYAYRMEKSPDMSTNVYP